MRKCGFSETQFSFNFTFEFLNKYPGTTNPFFPSTRTEGKHYGFDVCLGNYFIQFKKSHLYDIGDSPPEFYKAFNSVYFKIEINASRKQFKFLKRISKENNRFNKVLYSTPMFHTRKELKDYYSNQTVISNTACFSVNDFPDTLTGNHYMIYENAAGHGVLFSDPVRVPKSTIEINAEGNRQFSLSLTEMAEKLQGIILEVDNRFNLPNQLFDQDIIRRVWTYLLVSYNILWIPITYRK